MYVILTVNYFSSENVFWSYLQSFWLYQPHSRHRIQEAPQFLLVQEQKQLHYNYAVHWDWVLSSSDPSHLQLLVLVVRAQHYAKYPSFSRPTTFGNVLGLHNNNEWRLPLVRWCWNQRWSLMWYRHCITNQWVISRPHGDICILCWLLIGHWSVYDIGLCFCHLCAVHCRFS